MMKKLFPLFIFIIAFNVSAESKGCAVELFSKVYRLETNQTLSSSDIVHASDCDSMVLNKISQIVSNSNGTVGADFLKREIAKDYPTLALEISPRKTALLDLNSSMRDQLTSGSNLYFLDTKSLNGLRSLGLIEGEQLKVNCESCSTFGEKNLKIDITNPLANSIRSVWFTSKIMAKIKVFKAKRSLSFQQKHLDTEDFYADEIFTANPDNILTTLENIHFYKTNKTIIQGAVVSNFDLQAVNLINYGTPVSVTLKNQNINLSRKAIPSRSALFGETIELRNPNNNKIIAGKVVDYNKVVIEL
jgi:flagella basal body P-ring formation protein FlgA